MIHHVNMCHCNAPRTWLLIPPICITSNFGDVIHRQSQFSWCRRLPRCRDVSHKTVCHGSISQRLYELIIPNLWKPVLCLLKQPSLSPCTVINPILLTYLLTQTSSQIISQLYSFTYANFDIIKIMTETQRLFTKFELRANHLVKSVPGVDHCSWVH